MMTADQLRALPPHALLEMRSPFIPLVGVPVGKDDGSPPHYFLITDIFNMYSAIRNPPIEALLDRQNEYLRLVAAEGPTNRAKRSPVNVRQQTMLPLRDGCSYDVRRIA